MLPTPRNIIIFVGIGIVFVAGYLFFIKPAADTPNLVSDQSASTVPTATGTNIPATPEGEIAQNFLNVLLNVKTIKLNDSIFADPAFTSLHDSSITLIPDGNEGRPNPFAPIGTEAVIPVTAPTTVPTTTPNIPTAPSTGAAH